jgi:hypothetical protein
MVGKVLLETVVIDVDSRWDPRWLVEWPGAVPIEGSDKVRITLPEGTTPPREIAWILTDASLFTAVRAEQLSWRPPAGPAGMHPPERMRWGSTNRWWVERWPAEPAGQGPADAAFDEPMTMSGRPSSALTHRAHQAFLRRVAQGARMARAVRAPRAGR